MKQPAVTFLVPCYNVARCVEHCLDTILQPQVIDRIEVLAINDGSTDNTLEVLRRYEAKFLGTVRVIDKENGGWGTAINRGVHEAKGRYLKEIDADDWVDTTQLDEYVSRLETEEADYIATNYTEYWASENQYDRRHYRTEIYNNRLSLSQFWEQYPTAWAFPIHAITYRTRMLQEMPLRVGDRYYADLEYNTYPLPHVKSIVVLPLTVTIYFRGSNEQSTSTAGYAKHFQDYVAMSKRMILFSSQLDCLPARCHATFLHEIWNTALTSYRLMMSPEYAGHKPEAQMELKAYNRWLKEHDRKLYRYCGRHRKHGLRYILVWRWTGINLFKLRRK